MAKKKKTKTTTPSKEQIRQREIAGLWLRLADLARGAAGNNYIGGEDDETEAQALAERGAACGLDPVKITLLVRDLREEEAARNYYETLLEMTTKELREELEP